MSVFIIAEAGVNHNGSIDLAKKLIDAACNAGADAVKFQSFKAENLATKNSQKATYQKETTNIEESQFEMLKKLELSENYYKTLINKCKKLKIDFISTPYNFEDVDFLDDLDVFAFKVASGQLTELPFLRYVAKKNKLVIISTGMATFEEIGEALETAKSGGCNELAIFHCVSSYPTPLSAANLAKIEFLKKEFSVHVGLSDHTEGTIAGIAATALGATLIEKHFTLSRTLGGVDSSFSLEPDEMHELVVKTDETYNALGNNHRSRPKLEKENKIFRRSLYFVQDLKVGDMITEKHVRRIRPGFGLSPKYYKQILNKKALRNIKKGERVSWEDFEK